MTYDAKPEYNPTTNNLNVGEINRTPEHEVNKVVTEKTISTANTYYEYFSLSTFRKIALTILADVDASDTLVFTVWATSMNNDSRENLTYNDVTNEVFGVANYTPTPGGAGSKLFLDGLGELSACTWLRVQYVFTGSSGNTTVEMHLNEVF